MKRKSFDALQKQPYGNCQVLNIDGRLMFRCHYEKIDWYLDKGLASVVGKEPLTIQLNFKPNGVGHVGDIYYLSEKENICVVCGQTKSLTKHHVVPSCYRKFFPEDVKSHSSHDIVVLCKSCHREYEKAAQVLKDCIADEYAVPVGPTFNKEVARVRKAAHAIITHPLKEKRKILLYAVLQKYFNKTVVSAEELIQASKMQAGIKGMQAGKYVVEHEPDLEGFVKRWRYHFMTRMNPKYLPVGWSPERSIVRT